MENFEKYKKYKKICIIGNVCSGKTTLAKKISEFTKISVTHIDSIQFQKDLTIKPYQQTIETLEVIQSQSQWIIDGLGPFDLLEKRFQQADKIILIDPSIWHCYSLLVYRQLKNIFFPREELPLGANEIGWKHTVKLFKTIHKIHYGMRPELLRILTLRYTNKLNIIK